MKGSADWLGYRGKRIVVSGCFSGIGFAVARELASVGAEVHGLDWKVSDLNLASFTKADLREPVSIDRACAAFSGEFDALFNCAGIPPGSPPLDVMKVNYLGTRHLTDSVLPRLKPGSAIANIASNGGMAWASHLPDLRNLVEAEGFSEGTQWCAEHLAMVAEGYRFSKEAVIVWTMAASARTIRNGVRMNCTLPGAVQTPMLDEIEKTTAAAAIDQVTRPIGRRSSASEQAAALLFLNSPQASYVNGALLPVDGGFMAAMTLR